MLITDAPMHNGPPELEPVAPYSHFPAPRAYEDAVAAVEALDVLLVGLGATDAGRPSPRNHLRQLLRDTDSVNSDGEPLYFDIGRRGDRIGDEIVSAVQFVASEVPLDVDAVVEDSPGDALDATEVVRGIRALRADPPGNVASIDGETFVGVIPGTLLTFEVEFDASDLEPTPERRVYRARIIFRASGRSRLEVREIDIVVPGDDGLGCEADS